MPWVFTNAMGIFLYECVYQHHPYVYLKAHNELSRLCLYWTDKHVYQSH